MLSEQYWTESKGHNRQQGPYESQTSGQEEVCAFLQWN